jgi:succinate dehydrogenase/fumarate reductase flavoprotein subunit
MVWPWPTAPGSLSPNLLVDDGKVAGITALNLYNGQLEVIGAKAVIICTGGAGRIFPFTTNAAIKTGDGMALAYRAGVPLKDGVRAVSPHRTSRNRYPHH